MTKSKSVWAELCTDAHLFTVVDLTTSFGKLKDDVHHMGNGVNGANESRGIEFASHSNAARLAQAVLLFLFLKRDPPQTCCCDRTGVYMRLCNDRRVIFREQKPGC